MKNQSTYKPIARAEQVMNGECVDTFLYFTCAVTGQEIPESHPHFCIGPNKDILISEDGMDQLVENWIHRSVDKYSFGYPLILHYLIQRCTKRIRRDGHIPKSLRKEVLEKYKHTCVYCGSIKKLEIDHIHPVSKGGLTELKNLQVLCKPCNVRKSNKPCQLQKP